MPNYAVIFKQRRGGVMFTTEHRFLFSANILSRYLHYKGYSTLAIIKINH